MGCKMADTYSRGARAQIRSVAFLVARMHNLPLAPSHIGANLVAAVPAVFTIGVRNLGWTSLPYRLARRLHPTNDDWGCLIRDETKALFAIQAIREARLTPAQQAALNNAITASLALDATWNGAADIDDDPLQRNGV